MATPLQSILQNHIRGQLFAGEVTANLKARLAHSLHELEFSAAEYDGQVCTLTSLLAVGLPSGAHLPFAVLVHVFPGAPEALARTDLQHPAVKNARFLCGVPPHASLEVLLLSDVRAPSERVRRAAPEAARAALEGAANPVLTVVQLLPGTPVRRLPAARDSRIRWALDVASAATHLWDNGWVVPALSVDNVHASAEGLAVLADLGDSVVRVGERNTVKVQLSDAWLCRASSKGLLSPETEQRVAAARSQGHASVELDVLAQAVWALGLVVHDVLTGDWRAAAEPGRSAAVLNEAALSALDERGTLLEVARFLLSPLPSSRPAIPTFVFMQLAMQAFAPSSELHYKEEMGAALYAAATAGDAAAQCTLGRFMMQFSRFGILPDSAPLERAGISWCRRAMEQGNAQAMAAMGAAHMAGLGVPVDEGKALDLFRRAAELGDAQAAGHLADILESGLCLPEDKEEAAKWHRVAAEQGVAASQLALAKMHAEGDGAPQDAALAHELAMRAARQGLAGAQLLVTKQLQDPEKIADWLRRAAEQGEKEAQHLLGTMLMVGLGVPIDEAQGAQWLQRAAEQGELEAQCAIAMLRLEGKGMAKDVDNALSMLRSLAEQGVTQAQATLAWELYVSDDGVPQDLPEALRWARAAAAHGVSEAQYLLAVLHERGDGVPKNPAAASAWAELAAEQGRDEALLLQVRYFMQGIGCRKDVDDAMGMCEELALYGIAAAQFLTGNKYRWGISVPKDAAQAIRWYCRAAQLRHPPDPSTLLARQALREMTGLEWAFASNPLPVVCQGLRAPELFAEHCLKLLARAEAGEEVPPSQLTSLARRLLAGGGVPQDCARGEQLLLSLAERGHPPAQLTLSMEYKEGKSLPAKPAESLKWLQRAAEAGLSMAQRVLGQRYYLGDGVPANIENAIHWARLAVAQGAVDAMVDLSSYLFEAEQAQEGLRWLREAAEKGACTAQKELGELYFNGATALGVAADPAQGVQWLTRAAEMGSVAAQMMLFNVYAAGEGVERDTDKALQWCRCAAERGCGEAQVHLAMMLLGNLLQSKPEDTTVESKQRVAEEISTWLRKAERNGASLQEVRTVLQQIKLVQRQAPRATSVGSASAVRH